MMTEEDLSEQYPEAFEALPEPYQADSCLEFWKDGDMLLCRARADQVAILGGWVCWFDHPNKKWKELLTTIRVRDEEMR